MIPAAFTIDYFVLVVIFLLGGIIILKGLAKVINMIMLRYERKKHRA